MISNLEKAINKSHLDQKIYNKYYDDIKDYSDWDTEITWEEFDTEDWTYDEDI